MSSKPPMRLAMSPEAGPSRVVTTPTRSRSPAGVMLNTLRALGSTWLIELAAASETTSPKVWVEVATMKPTGCSGAVVPGGSTGRCTPRWPPLPRKPRMSAKLPNSGL